MCSTDECLFIFKCIINFVSEKRSRLQDKKIATILWDITRAYDSADLITLYIKLCDFANGKIFTNPLVRLIMSMFTFS